MARPARTARSSGQYGVIALIVLALAILITQRDSALERRQTPQLAMDIQTPIVKWVSSPIRSFERFNADFQDSRRASEENVALRAELTALRAETLRLQSMQFKLDRIESLLGVDLASDIAADPIAARVVSDSNSPFVRSYLLGAGRNEGVEDGLPVLSEAGLVGHIVRTGRVSSRVLRLDDLNSRVAVMSERSGARAILAGANRDAAELAFVSDVDDWAEGDRVLTSGDDGQLPQGLPVGTVIDGAQSVSLDFRRAPVDWVLVMPFTIIEPVEDEDVEMGEAQNLAEEAGRGSEANLTDNPASPSSEGGGL